MKRHFTPGRIIVYVIVGLIGAWLARAWDALGNFDNRAVCMMNQRNIQQWVRYLQETDHQKPGDPIAWDKIFGPKCMGEKPVCPRHGEYVYSKTVPKIGELAASCKEAKDQPPHSDW